MKKFFLGLFFLFLFSLSAFSSVKNLSPSNFGSMASYIHAKQKFSGSRCKWSSGLYGRYSVARSALIEQRYGVVADKQCAKSFLDLVQNGRVSFSELAPEVFFEDDFFALSILYSGSLLFDSPIDLSSDSLRDVGMSQQDLDAMALEYCKLKKNTFIAILWPDGAPHVDFVRKKLDEYGCVVHQKSVALTTSGARYLFSTIPEKRGNINHMMNYYFHTQNPKNIILRIFVCELKDYDTAVACKTDIRDATGLGVRCIHIDDNHAQTMDLAQLFLSDQTLHFVNYSKHLTMERFEPLFKRYKKWVLSSGLDQDLFCVDSSSVLALYGIRDVNIDLDFTHATGKFPYDKEKMRPIDCHNGVWEGVRLDVQDAIFNPKNHFYYQGMKVASLDITKYVKSRRGRERDKNDIRRINEFLKNIKVLPQTNI